MNKLEKKFVMKNIETYYHASPIPNLDKIGIDPNAEPHVSSQKQGWVYLGSLNYIYTQYMAYAKTGTYYIYQVDVTGLTLDDDLAGDQVRTRDYINPSRVTVNTSVHNVVQIHPLADDYRIWVSSRKNRKRKHEQAKNKGKTTRSKSAYSRNHKAT